MEMFRAGLMVTARCSERDFKEATLCLLLYCLECSLLLLALACLIC
jgi:hypothetical protein